MQDDDLVVTSSVGPVEVIAPKSVGPLYHEDLLLISLGYKQSIRGAR